MTNHGTTNHGTTKQLHFNAFLMSCGHHEAAWRLPESDPFANLDLGHWTKLAQLAERGTFDVSVALWDSWEDGAEIGDKAGGRYADPARIHPVDFAGEYFRVRGPLNVPRSPQGRPLLVQAGSSDDGREFAARYAEAVFTAQQTLADAQEFYAGTEPSPAPPSRSPTPSRSGRTPRPPTGST